MSFFSFLFKKQPARDTPENFKKLFNKELLVDIVNTGNNMLLIYSKKRGWIGGNRKFYDCLGYKDIHDFRRQHTSIKELILSESGEVFTDGDKAWLEYIEKHKTRGYQVRLYDKNNEI